MKTIAVLFALLLGSIVHGQTEGSGNITATVPNVNGTEGMVRFGLYNADTFMKTAPEFSVNAKIKMGKLSPNLKMYLQGTYALLVMHDKNDNGTWILILVECLWKIMDTSGNGMSYGPPNWDESKFQFDGREQIIEIRF